MRDVRRSSTRAAIVFVAIVACIGASFGSCTSYERSNGEQCIKDVDCLSGYCVAGQCSTPPPILSTPGYPGADTGTEDSGGDAGGGADSADSGPPAPSGDGSSDGPPAPDSAPPPQDSGHDSFSPLDTGADDGVDAAIDGGVDAAIDAAGDLDGASPDAADAQDAFNVVSRDAQLA